MNIKNHKLFYKYFFYLVSGIIYILCVVKIFDIIEVYYDIALYLLIFIYLLFGVSINLNKKEYFIFLYFSSLCVFLLFRNSEHGYNFDFYLTKWIKNIFNNKTIFINVLGNIILFIPMGILFYNKIIYAFLFSLIFESIQFIFKKGIFDIVDIVLYFVGIIIGVLGVITWNQIKSMIVKNKEN